MEPPPEIFEGACFFKFFFTFIPGDGERQKQTSAGGNINQLWLTFRPPFPFSEQTLRWAHRDARSYFVVFVFIFP